MLKNELTEMQERLQHEISNLGRFLTEKTSEIHEDDINFAKSELAALEGLCKTVADMFTSFNSTITSFQTEVQSILGEYISARRTLVGKMENVDNPGNG